MKLIKFLIEYFKSPRTIGAVAPSSERLAEKMVKDIDFENAKSIVEYGPGIGVFTEKLMERKRQDTILILCTVRYYDARYGRYRDLYEN